MKKRYLLIDNKHCIKFEDREEYIDFENFILNYLNIEEYFEEIEVIDEIIFNNLYNKDKINFIVGKSRKKEIVDSFILNGSTQFLAVILFGIFSWVVLKNSDIAHTIILCMIAVVLLALKIITLYALLRKII